MFTSAKDPRTIASTVVRSLARLISPFTNRREPSQNASAWYTCQDDNCYGIACGHGDTYICELNNGHASCQQDRDSDTKFKIEFCSTGQ